MNETRVRSGRQARQAERAKKGGGMGRPYIVRNIPTYDVLSEENLIRIEAAAGRVLAETGIEFRDDPATLELWRQAGACLVFFIGIAPPCAALEVRVRCSLMYHGVGVLEIPWPWHAARQARRHCAAAPASELQHVLRWALRLSAREQRGQEVSLLSVVACGT